MITVTFLLKQKQLKYQRHVRPRLNIHTRDSAGVSPARRASERRTRFIMTANRTSLHPKAAELRSASVGSGPNWLWNAKVGTSHTRCHKNEVWCSFCLFSERCWRPSYRFKLCKVHIRSCLVPPSDHVSFRHSYVFTIIIKTHPCNYFSNCLMIPYREFLWQRWGFT